MIVYLDDESLELTVDCKDYLDDMNRRRQHLIESDVVDFSAKFGTCLL